MEPGKPPFWRKEISFRRKAKGQAVPALSKEPARPESVADLLRPVADARSVLEPDPESVREAESAAHRKAMWRKRKRRQKAQRTVAKLADKARKKVAEEADRAEKEARKLVETVLVSPLLPPVKPEVPAEPALSAKDEKRRERSDRKRQEEGDRHERAAQKALESVEREQRKALERSEAKQRKEFERLEREERKRQQRLERDEAKSAPSTKERGAEQKRHKKLVGLKIGASQLAAAEILNNGGSRLARFARTELAPGIVVGGELREPEELAKALKAFFREHKLPRSCVRLGIANNRIGVRIFELSGIEDPRQLDNAIRFRAQETLPIPLDEAVLDYRILREDVGPEGVRIHRVLLVVAHKELVERYLAACRKAGVKLVGIDLEAFALLRAVGPQAETIAGDDAGAVVVSIGHDRSTLAVSDGTVCEFTRVLAWGGAALDAAIAEALEIPKEEAKRIKHVVALDPAVQFPVELRHDVLAAARSAMQAELQTFSRDLVASLRFYQEQPGSLGIGEIVLTGGCSHLTGLDTELERLIGVRVRIGDPLGRVKPARKARKEMPSGSLAAAIGLGIED